MKRKQIDDIHHEKSDQLFKALLSAADHRDSNTIEKVLTILNDGGKDLLMNYMHPFIVDYSESKNPLNQAVHMLVPFEIINKMIDIGGKEFLLKDYHGECYVSRWDGYTPLHHLFYRFNFDTPDNEKFEEKFSTLQLQLLPKLFEVGGRDLVMKKVASDGETALHCAVNDDRNKEATKELIEFGGKELVMTKNNKGNTALHHEEFRDGMSFEIVKLMIEVGGRDLLKEENNYGELAVQSAALFEDHYIDDNEYLLTLSILLIKEGINHNVGGEFSLGGLLEVYNDYEGDFDFFFFGEIWCTRILPALKEVYRQFQLEALSKTPPILHSVIELEAPKDVIADVLDNFDSITSMKDSLDRYAIDVAVETNLPFDEGLKEILEATASANDLNILHCASHHGLSWDNGMEELVLKDLDYAVNGVNEKTGLKLFMTAAIGGDLDTIYSLVRMDPMYIV